jgi:AraC family transcriptional regulator
LGRVLGSNRDCNHHVVERFAPSGLVTWPGLAVSVEAGSGTGRFIPQSTRHQVLSIKGEATLEVANRSIRVTRGDSLFVPAGSDLRCRWRGAAPGEVVHVWIAPARCREVERVLPAGATCCRLVDPMLASLADCLWRAAERNAGPGDRAVAGSAVLLDVRLAELLPGAPPPSQSGLSPSVLRRVCAHIDDQLAQPLAIPALARLANLSASHFTRSFKAATGVPPKQFVRRRRIALAQELLRTSDKALVDIALETGFGSQSAFTTTFSAFVGQSPARFRNSGRGSDES